MESVSFVMPETLSETSVNTSAVTPCEAASTAEDGERCKYAALSIKFRFELVELEIA